MALFPAYATENAENISVNVITESQSQDMTWEASDSREAQLLASDSEEEIAVKRVSPSTVTGCDDFYLDSKLDRGNLRVSTLYYPGRPQYERRGKLVPGEMGRSARRGRRYWVKRAPDAPDGPAVAERAAAYRELLLERTQDVQLWQQYIDFQEVCGGAEAALAAAELAVERLPRSRRLRMRLLEAARAALPRDRLLQRLRDLLAHEKRVGPRVELWCLLVEEAGAAGGAGAARAAATAALADTRTHPPAYPRLLHAYGVFLRTAGLWEELVLLMELAAGMAGALGQSVSLTTAPDVECRLLEAEERALASGLPLSTLWVRVERARASAHWRPAPAVDAAALQADPQRAPLAHDLADLLRPLVGAPYALLLCVTLLRLSKVPLFPESGYMRRAWGTAAGDCAEAMLPSLRAARRLHRAHPALAPPRTARRLLAALLDPPHYFTDDTGYLSWVTGLWDACCSWAAGERRAALVGWRLRWLHALLLLVDPAEEGAAREVSRIREEARAALQRFATDGPGAPLVFAQFARIELAVGGNERATRVATRALRAALQDPATPRHYALYIARIVCEVSVGGAGGAAGASALVSAVCGRLPQLDAHAPSDDELSFALQICEKRCEELERRFVGVDGGDRIEEGEAELCLAALLPGEAEWGATRALLASPARRACLLRALPAIMQSAGRSAAGERYCEQSACALVGAGAGAGAAYALSQLFPHNAFLALAGAGVPLWARRTQRPRPPPRAPSAALAALLPALLRAQAADWAPQEAEACARAVRRAGAGARSALLGALRLEAEGRAPCPRLLPALYEALDQTPHAKWLHVRGAAWCGGEAAALADALLDKQLRAHTLLDELAALAPAAPPAAPEVPAHQP